MVATLLLDETNGAPAGTVTQANNFNYGRLDQANMVPGNGTQIIVPPSGGPVYSFEKWSRIRLFALNGATSIENFRFWKNSGAYISGESLWINLEEGVEHDETYVQPVDTESALAVEVFPVATPAKNLYTGIGAGLDELNTAGQRTHYIVSQLHIEAGTALGDLNAKVFRVRWDEVV